MIVCTLCKIACLEPHPEFFWWRKCPICAFSCLPIESLSVENKVKAKKNPLVTRKEAAGIYFAKHDDFKKTD